MTKKKMRTGTTSKLLVEDDRWKMKGGAHKLRSPSPQVCPKCKGIGFYVGTSELCPYCDGTGEQYE
jgi:DnaJ-class molecular chaperone